MPMPYVPPTPPVPPHVIDQVDVNQKQQIEQAQKQNQKQDQQQVVNNNPSDYSNANNLKNDVRSAPDARINQVQSSSLNNYQINSQAESAWVKFSNATSVPVPQFYINGNYNRSGWGSFNEGDDNINFNVGITVPLGGRAKKLAYEEVKLNTLDRKLAICKGMGYFDGSVDIDFEVRKELSDCQGVNPVVKAQEEPSRLDRIRELRLQLEDSLRRQEQLRLTIQEITEKRFPIENGTDVSVGG